MLVFLKARERDILSPAVFHDETSNSLCCMSMLSKSEVFCCNTQEMTQFLPSQLVKFLISHL